ncbi:MAG: type 1 glutamine amidotransferase [Candidatus Lambdaproteobacteria bacterium]|nr:type 1 glutamine amidotransferase [Candidatus Lambdaproteobacteria bacterium]
MRIAVLQTGRAPREARARRGDYGRMFVEFFHAPGQWDVLDVEHGEFPARVNDYDAYIVTGSKYSAYDDVPFIHRLLELIRELDRARVRTLGICFGHQALAQALGGWVQPNPLGWALGVRDLHFTPAAAAFPALDAVPRPLRILQTHMDMVTVLPPGAVHLAHSADTPVEMFALGGHLLGLQGHPELDAEVIRETLRKLGNVLTPSQVQAAQSSLALAPHDAFLHDWLLDFLTHGMAQRQPQPRPRTAVT